MRPAIRIIFAPTASRVNALGESLCRTIWIDPRRRNVGHTLLHELLHVGHPDWSETRVRRETAREWRRMTWIDKGRLYKLLGHAQFEKGNHKS